MFLSLRARHRRTPSTPCRWADSAGATFIVDREGTILGFDPRMETLTGWPAVEVVGRHKDRVPSPAARTRWEPGTSALYEGELAAPGDPRALELRLQCSDGDGVDVEAEVARLAGRGERFSVTVLRVVGVSTRSPDRRAPDGRDALTGLHDRPTFAEHLSRSFQAAREQGRPLALILADVDRLRTVNDRWGRRAGDDVLVRLAGLLREAVRDDGGIARVGDDDFAILLPDVARGETRQIAAGLRSTVERTRFLHGCESHRVTLSLGTASFPADAESGADLMRRAQDALDEARALGRNRVWCYTRRPRVPLEVPVYFDSAAAILAGFTHDLSPSGVFVHTSQPVDVGMRCALTFPLPEHDGNVHVVGRVVRTVLRADGDDGRQASVPGMGIEFERFGAGDRRAVEAYLHAHEANSLRPDHGFSV